MEQTLIENLRNRLKEGLVSFTYTKKDGSKRNATGTTNPGRVAEHNATPKGTGYDVADNTTRYYDTVSEGWRSFKNDNLVSIDD